MRARIALLTVMVSRVFPAMALMAMAAAAQAGEPPGYTLYLLHCSGCHGPDGLGENRADVPPLPPLVGNLLRDPRGRGYLVNVGGVVTSNLNYADTAAVLNWLMHAFGSTTLPANTREFDADEVRDLRAQRNSDSVGLRRSIAARLKSKGIKLAAYPWP